MSIRSPHQSSAATGRYGRVAVIGAGAWGTALAAVAAASGSQVLLWAREPDVVQTVSADRENTRFLPGAKLPAAIEPTLDIVRASAGGEAVLVVAPAQHLRPVLLSIRPQIKPGTPVVVCA